MDVDFIDALVLEIKWRFTTELCHQTAAGLGEACAGEAWPQDGGRRGAPPDAGEAWPRPYSMGTV